MNCELFHALNNIPFKVNTTWVWYLPNGAKRYNKAVGLQNGSYQSCRNLLLQVYDFVTDFSNFRDNTRSASNGATVYGLDIDNMSSQKRLFTHSFFPRCVSHWNALPQGIRSAMSYPDFISKLETWIWDSVVSRISEIDPEPD